MTECFIIKKPAVHLNNSWGTSLLRWCCFSLPLFIFILSMLVICGCKKKNKDESAPVSQAPVSRLQDKEYVAALKKHREDQKVVARERNQLVDEMETVCKRVKASLKPDASEEEYKAALEKDEEWQKLLEKQARLDQDVKDVLEEARNTVRERLIRDQVVPGAAKK